jgi:hypothetical protein
MMAYLVELDVDAFGVVDGPEELFPVNVIEHDWLSASYPSVVEVVPFRWKPGENGNAPDVFWYPQMRDWVCSARAYETLTRTSLDLHLIADGRLGRDSVFVVQVLTVLDVIDPDSSIIDRYPSYQILRFPTFFRKFSSLVENRIFRIPESPTMIFMGETVKLAVESSGIRGFDFTPVEWSDSQ